MKKMLAVLLCLLSLCAGTVLRADCARAESTFGAAVIDAGNSDRIHLRRQPSTDSPSLGLYFTGTLVTARSTASAQWVAVTVGTESGYMMSQYLSFDAAVDSRQPLGLAHNPSGSRVNVRSAPTTDADVLWVAKENDAFTVLGETVTGWYCVQSGDSTGYIRSDLLLLTDRIAQGAVTPLPATGTGTPASTPVPPSGDELSAYGAVLRGDAPVLTEDYGQAYLSRWPTSYDGRQLSFPRFALVDMDADGAREVLLEEAFDGIDTYGYLILHAEGGAIYGHELVYRACLDPKADGTFSYSSGAADNGFGRLAFSGTSHSITAQTYSEGGASITYVVDFAPASESAFMAAINAQAAKPDAVWYELTDANIAAIWGN